MWKSQQFLCITYYVNQSHATETLSDVPVQKPCLPVGAIGPSRNLVLPPNVGASTLPFPQPSDRSLLRLRASNIGRHGSHSSASLPRPGAIQTRSKPVRPPEGETTHHYRSRHFAQTENLMFPRMRSRRRRSRVGPWQGFETCRSGKESARQEGRDDEPLRNWQERAIRC